MRDARRSSCAVPAGQFVPISLRKTLQMAWLLAASRAKTHALIKVSTTIAHYEGLKAMAITVRACFLLIDPVDEAVHMELMIAGQEPNVSTTGYANSASVSVSIGFVQIESWQLSWWLHLNLNLLNIHLGLGYYLTVRIVSIGIHIPLCNLTRNVLSGDCGTQGLIAWRKIISVSGCGLNYLHPILNGV